MKGPTELLIQRDGPLTRELLLQPGKFGLGRVPKQLDANQRTSMVCGFCSTGCSLDVWLKDGEVKGILPTSQYPVNRGVACPKGWEALAPLRGKNRATIPLVRQGSHLTATTWQEALHTMASRFKAIAARHGSASVAWLGTGQLPTEELAYLGALAKFGMGMVHGDGNTRQCMATAAVAYKTTFGFDAPPFSYEDLEQSDVLVFVGANPCIAHPVLWERVVNNPHRPQIVVIDPRRTETAMAAKHHFAVKPKGDLALLYTLANVLIARGWIDKAYIAANTTGFDDFTAHVAAFTLEQVESATGIEKDSLLRLAELIHQGQRVSFWWTMGVNQSHEGVATAQAIIALALLTGNIGRPGTGANSITGQCNAMGSRLFSNTTNLLGGRDFGKVQDRQEVARLLNMDVACIPTQPSLAYDQIVEEILSGKIRGLWIVATNPAHSWINQRHLREVLAHLDCLVVQDMYHDTETARLADIVLPAAGWGEKEGTFINSERRIGVIKRVSHAPGEALADFHIFQLVAEAFGVAEQFREWSSPEAVFQIMKRLSAGRPCDITGIEDYAMLDRHGGIQWPLPAGTHEVETDRRLFADGRYFTADARAQFCFAAPRPLPEQPSARFPLLLLTGRGSSAQWHTQTRTRCSEVLRRLSPEELHIQISPQDAKALNIAPDERVQVASQRGCIEARAFITNSVSPGQVFLPMHYPEVNQLTFAAFDPQSRQPAYKACAVKVQKLDAAP